MTEPVKSEHEAGVGVVGRSYKWDVFVSHASEDKASVARPLAQALIDLGLRVWYDEFSLTLGDSLRRKIDDGLASSRFGVVVLSPSFFAKEWPQAELDGLVSLQRSGRKVILPVWHNISAVQLRQHSPTLADLVAVDTSRGIKLAADQILRVIEPSNSGLTTELSRGSRAPDDLASYRSLLREEIHDNLVLEIFERSDFEAMCIQPRFVPALGRDSERRPHTPRQLLESGRVTVVGEPGSGKTTALRLLALDLLRDAGDGTVPVYVPLASFRGNIACEEPFREHINEELRSLAAPSLEALESTGRPIALLLDGWDEVGDGRLERDIRRFLLSSEHSFVLTTRPEAVRSAPTSERFDVLRLGPEEIREFAARRISDSVAIDGFVKWILGDPSLTRLAANPLNLSIMLIVFAEDRGATALSRTDLYARAFDAILRQHHRAQGSTHPGASPLLPSQLEAVLIRVAYDTLSSGQGRFFSPAQLDKAAALVLGQVPPELPGVLSGRLGIIRNRRAGGFEFFHLWYQEFLAARFVLEANVDLVEFFGDPRHASLLPFVAGLQDRKGCGTDTLLSVPIPDVFNFCRAVSEVSASTEALGSLIDRALAFAITSAPQLPVRIEVAPALASIGHKASAVLAWIARDARRPEYDRRSGLEAYLLLVDQAQGDELLLDLARSSSEGLLWHVVEHLGRREVHAATPILGAYRNSPDPILRADAAWALSNMHGSESSLDEGQVRELIALLGAPEHHARGHALRSLGRLRLKEAIPDLAAYLAHDAYPYRWIVAEATANIGGAKAAELLAVGLSDEDRRVAAAAAEGLRHIRAPLPLEILARLSALESSTAWITASGMPLGLIATSTLRSLCSQPDRLPQVLVCRHASTSWNEAGRLQGRSDPGVSELGLRRARAEAQELAALGIARIICSPLRRALETAAIYAEALSVPLKEDERLTELDHGAWEGSLLDDLLQSTAYASWLRSPGSIPIPAARESFPLAAARVAELLGSLVDDGGGRALVVGHKHSLAAGATALMALPPSAFDAQIVEDTRPRFYSDQAWRSTAE